MKKPNPYDINRIFEQMTLELIESLKRNSRRHKLEEIKEGFRWEQWQSAKLRAIAKYRNDNRKIIRESMKQAERLVDDVLVDSFKQGESLFSSLWRKFFGALLMPYKIYKRIRSKRTKLEIKLPKNFEPRKFGVPHYKLPIAPKEESFFKMNNRKLEALQQTVKNDLRKARHGVLRKMDDVYRQVIYKAEVNMTAGAKTLNQAIDMATKEFLSKGINTIEYADGRKVSIGAYAEMALRTASQRATFLGEGKKRDEWGVYTVLMSAHANCSPMCLPYQGTVMIDDVYTSITKEKALELQQETKYVLLSAAMKNHAFHPNCRHTLATFFPGVSSLPEIPDDEEAQKNNNAEQKQRYMERQIRKYKRLETGTLDEQTQAKYSAKVQEWQGRLKQHLSENPQLRRDYTREKVEGGLSVSDRTSLLKRATEREKIEGVRKLIQSDAQPKNVHEGAQGKHFKDHHNYIEGRSYLTITPEEVQGLVNKYAGTGEINFTNKGDWRKTEVIEVEKIIGVSVNNLTGEEFKTNMFKIHYSKKGVHIVPFRKG